jgi:WD40 repeat protein
VFTPDGKTMLTRHGGPLIVWDVEGKKVARTVPVGSLQFASTGLSPDGRRAAVAGMPKFDTSLARRGAATADLPQPRLMLIDLVDPKSEPEVLMLPDGAVNALAFSPDGKTLALGAFGGVHLIDLSARPK